MADLIEPLRAALAARYRIGRELGSGGMAAVYLAHDLRHDRDVAIKVLHPDLAAALGGRRFLAEVRTTANLHHPHILPLHDSGDVNGTLFYVMPFVTGETLRDRLAREKQLPIHDAIRITTDIAAALDYAHRRGVLHRDIKPENILLHEGSAILADFGIAISMHGTRGERLTGTGVSLGTPQYMSPEQAAGERGLDARSDVYSLGVVTYEMLTGEPPITGRSPRTIVAKLLTETPTAPRVVRDTVPPEMDAAVMRALSKIPTDRFPSAGEFAAAVAPQLLTPPSVAVAASAAPGPAPQRSRWIMITAAVIALAALLVLGVRILLPHA